VSGERKEMIDGTTLPRSSKGKQWHKGEEGGSGVRKGKKQVVGEGGRESNARLSNMQATQGVSRGIWRTGRVKEKDPFHHPIVFCVFYFLFPFIFFFFFC
jgi:hypothetical protein